MLLKVFKFVICKYFWKTGWVGCPNTVISTAYGSQNGGFEVPTNLKFFTSESNCGKIVLEKHYFLTSFKKFLEPQECFTKQYLTLWL